MNKPMRCRRCGRKIKVGESVIHGMGAECYQKFRTEMNKPTLLPPKNNFKKDKNNA